MSSHAAAPARRWIDGRSILGLLIVVLLTIQLLTLGGEQCPLRPGERPNPVGGPVPDLSWVRPAAH